MTSALISRLCRWAQLPSDALGELEGLSAGRIDLNRGQNPLDTFDSTTAALFMLEGWAARYKTACNGRRVIIELLLPGDVQLPTIHRDCTIETRMLTCGTAIAVPACGIAALSKFEVVREALDWTAKVRESIRAEWIVNMSARKALPRLAHFFCELSTRMNSVDLLDGDRFEMPLTQIDMADALSMTSVHLNLALQKLRAAKLVEVSSKHLRILDRSGLEAVAGFDDAYLLRWPTRLPERRSDMPASPLLKDRRSSTSHKFDLFSRISAVR
jgi:CRP-like cAMP-binding protein